jgi:hypothetical protein
VVKIPGVPSVRLTVRSSLYVVVVAVIAAVGFTEQSAWPILFAALLAVPASIVAMPCYYLVYAFLALVPGANPSSSSGSVTFAPDGRTLTVSTGMPPAWFTITTLVLGILALMIAAYVNVLLLRALAARRRSNEPV